MKTWTDFLEFTDGCGGRSSDSISFERMKGWKTVPLHNDFYLRLFRSMENVPRDEFGKKMCHFANFQGWITHPNIKLELHLDILIDFPKKNSAKWGFQRKTLCYQGKRIRLSSFDTLIRVVKHRPMPHRKGPFKFFRNDAKAFEMVLTKLLFHPRRDEILQLWVDVFNQEDDISQEQEKDFQISFAKEIGLIK